MIYLDTSCLLKLVRIESDSEAVAEAIDRESHVVISSLAELEATIELKAGYLAGDYSLAQWRKLEARLSLLRNEEPFHFKDVPGSVWPIASIEIRGQSTGTADRLHLAALEQFRLIRLMTHDEGQSTAAEALSVQVIRPGR